MRVTHSIDEIGGMNRAAGRGLVVSDPAQLFVTMGVTIASTLYNKTSGKSGTVTAVTETTIETADVYFEKGDFYLVTLVADWVVKNSLGEVAYDYVCRVCGFSKRESELVGGKCVDCRDLPKGSRGR